MFLGNKQLLRENSGDVLDCAEDKGLTISLPQYVSIFFFSSVLYVVESPQPINYYSSAKSEFVITM